MLAGDDVVNPGERLFTFFSDAIRNRNTGVAYYPNALRFFAWAEQHSVALKETKSYCVSSHLEVLTLDLAAPSVKHQLASLRTLWRLSEVVAGWLAAPL